MKRSLLVTFILLVLATTNAFASEFVDVKNIDNGIIAVEYSGDNAKIMKVMIQKGENKNIYSLKKQREEFSLQMGNGSYTISLLENVEGNKYRLVAQDKVVLDIKDENKVFLGSIQMIQWNENMMAIKKAKELVKNVADDEEKIAKIYQYIINNVEYDYEKANAIKPDYIPQIEKIFENNKGICYDYAALFAAMLRSVGVPTKLVMGHADGVKEYHAWNEVYLKNKEQWVIIDTTVDAQYVQGINQAVNMIKDKNNYRINKQY